MKLYVGCAVVISCNSHKASDEVILALLKNNAKEAAAIVTRVHGVGDTLEGPQMVNASAFPDCATQHTVVSSVMIYDTQAEAEMSGAPIYGWTVPPH